MTYKKTTMIAFLLPLIFVVILVLVYPSFRTIFMSFHEMPNLTSPVSQWQYVGLDNYYTLFSIRLYRQSLINILAVWALSGFFTIGTALMLASALTSDIKYTRIFTIIIYLPEVISTLALGYVWLLYVYDPKFGLFRKLGELLSLEFISNIRWTTPDMIFYGMTIAGSFAAVGYFTLTYIAALKKIPNSLYEASIIEGSNKLQRFTTITLPLISNETRTIFLIFSMATINYFVFPLIFTSASTITPLLFTYNTLFGTDVSTTNSVGVGAASAVVMMLAAVVIFIVNIGTRKNAKLYY